MNTNSEDEIRRNLLSLKLLILAKEKTVQEKEQVRTSTVHIFEPQNDLEIEAIALALDGDMGWQGSLYSLEYCDRYQDHTCFIFATRPQSMKVQEWLLVSVDRRDEAKYWVTLAQKLLPEVYYSWAKVVGIPHPRFDPQRMEKLRKGGEISRIEDDGSD